MKVPELAKALNELEDDLILAAEEYKPAQHKRKPFRWTKWKTAAACLVVAGLVLGAVAAGQPSAPLSQPLTVSAAQLGQEEYLFGVSLPEIVYADSEMAILYDFRGIYVYNFHEKRLVGYSDFRTRDMTLIQGSNPTCVSVSEDGQLVKFYNDEKKFIYYPKKNETVPVKDYEEIEAGFTEYRIRSLPYGDENGIEGCEITCIDRENAAVAVLLDYDHVDESGELKYKNLHIVRVADSERIEYAVFE